MKTRITAAALCLLLLAACTGNAPAEPPLNIADFALSIDRTDLRAFTVSQSGEFYAIPVDGVLTQYTYDGEEIKTYPGTEMFYNICARDKYIYAYDGAQRRFARLDCAGGEISGVGEELDPYEIKNVVAAGDTLYALVVMPDEDGYGYAHDLSVTGDGYIDFGERLLAVNIKSGKTSETGIDCVMAVYAGTDDMLYYYAYTKDGYGLYTYAKGKSAKVSEMNETGYLVSFIYENGQFAYFKGSMALQSRDMTTGREITVYNDILILTASGMQYYAGNVILLNTFMYDEIITMLQSFNVNDPFDSGGMPENLKVTVSASNVGLINTGVVYDLSGITVSYMRQPDSEIESLTRFMAGEPDVDVYLGYSVSVEMPVRLEKGVYSPLNGSAVIEEYLNGCFDYISEAARAPSGEIWMLPLYAHAEVLWYVPENMERFGVTPDDVKYFSGFIDTVKRLNEESAELSVYVNSPARAMDNFQFQYEMTYYDKEKNTINYNTDLFLCVFTTFYEGAGSSDLWHPLFRNSYLDQNWRDAGRWAGDEPCLLKERVIFKQAGRNHINDMIEYRNEDPFDGWRALPMPLISEEVKGNAVYLQYAVINPLSRNKEAAMKLLETVAANPFETIRDRHFLTKDPEAYRDHYNISQPGFHDLLAVYRDGVVVENFYPSDLSTSYIVEYQAGRLTAGEAIMVLQREVEMWLNE